MASFLDLDEDSEGDTVAVFPSMQAARSYLERTATWAVDLLDQLSCDPDMEEGGDLEPYLADAKTDLEDESEHDEPSLGSLDRQPQDRSYRQGREAFGQADLEGDERGLDPDLEPSLGWTEHAGQLGSPDDREQDAGDEREEENEHGSEAGDAGDNGIADRGGLDWLHDRHAEGAAKAAAARPSICNVTMLGDLREAPLLGSDGKSYMVRRL